MSDRDATFWNGEPCIAVRGTGCVLPSSQFPLFWGRELVGERIQVVFVHYYDTTFYLDDRDGAGWAKVRSGGSPRVGHRNLAVSGFRAFRAR